MSIRKIGLFLLVGILSALGISYLLFPLENGLAAGGNKSQKSNKLTKQVPPNFDALAAAETRAERGVRENQTVAGGRVAHTEPRFDVPTFIWATDQGPAQASKTSGALNRADAETAARAHLGKFAASYRLNKSDVAAAKVASVHDTGKGAIIVKFKQSVGGIEVFRDEVNIIMNRNLQLVALSGYLTGDNTQDAALSYNLQPADALGLAVQDLTGAAVDNSKLQRADETLKSPRNAAQNPYQQFTADKDAFKGFSLSDEPSRVKQVLFHLPEGLVPAFYVETSVMVPSTDNLLSLTDDAQLRELGYAYVISAIDGQILFRKNLISEQANTYRVWADPATKIPFDTPAGNSVHPKPSALPDGAQYGFVAQQDVTLQNYPFSMNDPWLPAGATETVGNNADAFLNLYAPDGYGSPTTTSPTDNPTGDYRAQVTAPGVFLHSFTAGTMSSTAEARQSAIQQLFYNINFLHDWYYDAGFNEAAGNAQTSNYGRGGLANDNIKAQAQDYSGYNNANMLTPADGSRPRMRMYIFPSIGNNLEILAPSNIASKRSIGVSMSGPQAFDITSNIVRATFSNSPSACTVTNAAALAGNIALFDFDNTDGTGCSFSTRISRITTTTGATAMIMVYTSGAPTIVANITGYVAANSKPVATISWNSGTVIKNELTAGNAVMVRFNRQPDRDGTLDNQIVAHEWGHYISNRLVGNAAGLNTNMAGGLGEGWGDFTALMLTVRPDDTSVPTNANWNGAYALATYTTSGTDPNGVGNNGYYFGIRRAPYSTDFNINPLTYRHIANGQTIPAGAPLAFGADGLDNAEVHNTGEVWTNMLWECYAALLRDTQGASPRLTFQQAQDRMKNYLVAAYKMTPLSPTLLEARDAVIAAALTNDPVDGQRFAQAFAKRGAGSGATAPDRYSTTNVGATESYSANGVASYIGASLDDSITTYDNDGYLDSREKGLLKITIRNTGLSAVSGATVTASSNNPLIGFPDGASAAIPTLQPYSAAVTVSIPVEAGNMFRTQQIADFNITINDGNVNLESSLTTVNFTTYSNVDELTNTAATDTVEAKQTPWTIASNPSLSQDASAKWQRAQNGNVNYVWYGPNPGFGSDQYLTSPVFTADGGGSVNLQFDHSFGFEFDATGNYDGGVVEMSVNGGAFTDIGTSAYNGTLVNYSGNVNPLAGRPAFVKTSGGTIHTSLTQAIAPGSTVQIRFRIGADAGVGAAGWQIDNIAFSGVVETPFTTLVTELAPTAANVSVEGRVLSDGRALARALVSYTDAEGVVHSTRTNSFGFYRFDNVRAGYSYVFNASLKGYSFDPLIVNVNDAVENLDFTAAQ